MPNVFARHAVTGHLVLTAALLTLAGCGGSKDAGPGYAQTTLSSHSVAFAATSPDAPLPAAQVVTATLTSGTVMLAVVHSGSGIAKATYTLSGTTAQISIEPTSPATIGAGSFPGAVAVTGYTCANANCSTLAPGNTETIQVSYRIAPVVRLAAPYVAFTNVSNSVKIRGQGFNSFPPTGVTFGGIAATSFVQTIGSDTEINAVYPALPAGTYPIQVQVTSTTTPPIVATSTATLVVVDPPAFTATTLAYPAAAPNIRNVVYDNERRALLVAVDTGGGAVLRFPYTAGAWGAPTSVNVTDLQDIALSTAGTKLIGLAKAGVTQFDPTSLAAGTVSTTTPPSGQFLKSIAISNDDNAYITTGATASGATYSYPYSYSVRDPTLNQATSTYQLDNATAVMAANGSFGAVIQGDSTLTATPPLVYGYTAATNSVSPLASGLSLNQNGIASALDRTAARLALNGANIYDSAGTLLGALPTTTLAVAFKPDGTRAYTYDSAAAGILTFDTSVATANGVIFPQVGTTTPIPGAPGNGVRMIVSLDGSTLFLVGSTQVVVVPAP